MRSKIVLVILVFALVLVACSGTDKIINKYTNKNATGGTNYYFVCQACGEDGYCQEPETHGTSKENYAKYSVGDKCGY